MQDRTASVSVVNPASASPIAIVNVNTTTATATQHIPARIPLWLKWGYTAFMAVLIPVYWMNYGPSNFLYFCDVALFLTWISLWTERSLPASMAAVGILIPQLLWCVDLVLHLVGFTYTGMTNYMFDAGKPLFLRLLSLFHGWLPFLLLYIVARLGYDRRGFKAWTVTAVILCLVSYFLLPAPGDLPPGSVEAVNVNYVFGIDDTKAQTWMAPGAYLGVWMLVLLVVCYIPANYWLKSRYCRKESGSHSRQECHEL